MSETPAPVRRKINLLIIEYWPGEGDTKMRAFWKLSDLKVAADEAYYAYRTGGKLAKHIEAFEIEIEGEPE